MVSDLRQALRTLRKSPGFSALVVVVLALGIGANTTIFSIVNGVLLKPLPFSHPHRIVAVDTTIRNEPDATSYPDFLDWRTQATTFERLAAYNTAGITLTGSGEALGMACAVVSPDLLTLLGVPPLHGRVFAEDDDRPGAARTVILSEALWSKRFSRDPAVVGRSITLDGDPFVVIGVMPASFEFPFDAEDPPQVWLPIRASRFASQWAELRSAAFLKAIGRVRNGVDLKPVQAEMTTIAGRLAAQYPRNQGRGILVRPFQEVLVREYRLGLIVLLSAVAAVLLIACANLANLLLARGSARRRELAVRVALGASRGRLVRQLLAESILLAIAGGAAGGLLALWGVDALVRLSPLQIPRLHAVHVDRGALLFTALISALTGIASGLVPAFQLSRSNPGESLKDGERGGSGRAGTRTRHMLVAAEMAVSLLLLASAGLLVRSLVALQQVNPGFATERAVAMQLLLPGSRYPDGAAQRAFYRRLRAELSAMPGAASSGVSTTLPMSGSNIDIGFAVEGRPAEPGVRTSAMSFSISPEYFATMGIPLVKGRAFTDRDGDGAPLVLIVNEAMAAKYWPNDDPIGKRITINYGKTGPREIVGVVGNVKQTSLADPPRPQLYAPYEQVPWPFVAPVVRTAGATDAAAASIRAALARVDPLLGTGPLQTLEQYISRTVATPRFTTLLVGAFATLALLMAGFGLFSVMAYTVAQRGREIGIRMALGAQAGDVRRMVVGQALRIGGIGLVVGLVGALVTTRVLESLLYGIQPNDPATFVAVSLLLLAAMMVAAYLPARRATRVDPIVALRTE